MGNIIDIIITANDMEHVHQKLTHPQILKAAQSGLVSLFLDQEGCVLTVPNHYADTYIANLTEGLQGTPGLQIAKQ